MLDVMSPMPSEPLNVWADAFTNARFSDFCPQLRESTPFEELDFLVFDKLRALEAADKQKDSLQATSLQDSVQEGADSRLPFLKKDEVRHSSTPPKRRRVSFRDWEAPDEAASGAVPEV